MITVSELTGEMYHDEDMVFFRNCTQSSHYIAWGAKLWDLFVDSSYKLVFVFSKEDHLKYRDRWGTKDNNDRVDNDG